MKGYIFLVVNLVVSSALSLNTVRVHLLLYFLSNYDVFHATQRIIIITVIIKH